MRRYLGIALIVVGIAALFLWWRSRPASGPGTSDAAPAVTGSHAPVGVSDSPPQTNAGHAELVIPAGVDKSWYTRPEVVKALNEAQNVPVYFYGLVVDQDSNPVPNVAVDLEVTQLLVDQTTAVTEKTTRLQKQTGADGRFEVSGMTASIVAVKDLTKEGYEPELRMQQYGEYGAQSTGFDHPAVFSLWSTNHHEQLITGEKSFVIIPDGRHYAIDLIKSTIVEGDEGDLVAWIKRPESVRLGQRYDWSCALTTPGGGLLQDDHYAMFTAPETGYTNAFSVQEAANPDRWSGGFAGKRFYIKLRNGQMYGRIVVDLYANYRGKDPALIRLSYAVNPSGSRSLW